MRYLALCTDYDGTIAHHGRVDKPTIAALEDLRASGRKLVLVTGREMVDLHQVFDRWTWSISWWRRTARLFTGPRPAKNGRWAMHRRAVCR